MWSSNASGYHWCIFFMNNRLNEVVGNHDVTFKDMETIALGAIPSVNKNEIVNIVSRGTMLWSYGVKN